MEFFNNMIVGVLVIYLRGLWTKVTVNYRVLGMDKKIVLLMDIMGI